MKKTKGFTLVELLVVIVILGIITGISIPLIRNIQAKNEQRQYKTYQDSLKYSAKLYVDSYSEDLFGHSKSGCAIITYQQMVEKGLLKDITVSDVSCATNNTLVRAVMFDNKISYTPMIGCGKVVGGSVEVETVLPEAIEPIEAKNEISITLTKSLLSEFKSCVISELSSLILLFNFLFS